MKVNYSPIVSDVSGRFQGMVFSRWQGVNVVRKFTPPSQPRTVDQVEVRNLFREMNRAFREYGRDLLPYFSWVPRSAGRPGIARNFFLGENVRALQGKTDLADFEPFGFGVRQISTDWTLAVAAGTNAGELDVTCTPSSPTIPAGYEAYGFVVVAAEDLDYGTTGNEIALEVADLAWVDGTTAVEVTFDNLTAGTWRGFANLVGRPTGASDFSVLIASDLLEATATVT